MAKCNVMSWFSRFAGRRKDVRRESLPCGNLSEDGEAEARRRPSFLKMVSLGKLKRESLSDRTSQEAEEETVEEEPVVKPREPLSGKHTLEQKRPSSTVRRTVPAQTNLSCPSPSSFRNGISAMKHLQEFTGSFFALPGQPLRRFLPIPCSLMRR